MDAVVRISPPRAHFEIIFHRHGKRPPGAFFYPLRSCLAPGRFSFHFHTSPQSQRLGAQINIDVRAWLPGAVRILAHLRVPANLAPGTYRLALWLPDAATSLRTRSEYSIQLANQGIRDAAHGDNTLLAQLTISPTAPGGADPTAKDFAIIP